MKSENALAAMRRAHVEVRGRRPVLYDIATRDDAHEWIGTASTELGARMTAARFFNRYLPHPHHQPVSVELVGDAWVLA